MSIEDDLAGIIRDAINVPVYARYIPPNLPDCVSVQVIGGTASPAGIKRATDRVSVIAVNHDYAEAMHTLRTARDILILGLPQTVNGVRYYRATSESDGSMKRKSRRGATYLEYTDMEVERSL